MHKYFLRGHHIARFPVTNDDRFDGESNASLVARIAWKYRLNPAQFVSKAILDKKHTNADLRYGVASICNSLTDKSLSVHDRLYELTGRERECGNYTYLRELVDHAAHGLISKEKKWCHQCYQTRRNFSVPDGETPIYDDLYWSFTHATYCAEHYCTLSNRCGHCFQKQPYISHKVEPGFCHHCRGFLGKAPSIEVVDDADAIDVAVDELDRHDLFHRGYLPFNRISMKVLARNLRQLASRFGEDGMCVVANACGVSHTTYADWCRTRHNVSVESLFMLQEGLELPSIGTLLDDEADFCSIVSSQISSQFQFREKRHYQSVLPEITKHLKYILMGIREPEPRTAIAKRFNVSVGMLENAFKEELKKVSKKYRNVSEVVSLEKKDDLQHLMNAAVRRCGAKMRKLDWEHIMAELKGVNLSNYSLSELSDARDKAIERYIRSSRRDQGRDIDSLL